MKAVVYDKKAHPDRLVYCDVDRPDPGENEVLVRVHSVSLNAADYRSMKMGLIPKRKIFGADISGRVEAVGVNIREFSPGDEVAGDLAGAGFGGLAEYVTAPEAFIVHKPKHISYEEAAAIPMAGVTALQALRDKAAVQREHKVLIIGSAGGVGTFAVQLAKYFGCEVTGVCSTRNLQQNLSLGADHVIDYSKERFLEADRRYDIILGINGNYSLSACRRILTSHGVYVMIGGSLSQVFKSILFGWLLSSESRKMRFLSAKPNKTDLEFLMGLLEKGIIRPVISRQYSLERTGEAMNYLMEGHSSGKVVINIMHKE
jgi:NADPH:quinone reductase-like Zn-dependent oxidoreductase